MFTLNENIQPVQPQIVYVDKIKEVPVPYQVEVVVTKKVPEKKIQINI